jgi:hypothetical protein
LKVTTQNETRLKWKGSTWHNLFIISSPSSARTISVFNCHNRTKSQTVLPLHKRNEAMLEDLLIFVARHPIAQQSGNSRDSAYNTISN